MTSSYWRKRRVLVTGHEGLLGSWLTKALIKQGSNLIGLDKVKARQFSVLAGFRDKIKIAKGNVSSLTLVKKVIKRYKPQTIFHLAAQAIVGEANKDPIETFKSNIQGTWNLLEAARGNDFIESIVVASSDKAYGVQESLPYQEDSSLRGSHPYDVSKSCADLLSYTYYNTYGLPVCMTRCGNIFGPGDHHFSRIVPDTVRKALAGETLLIRSDGKFTRDYIYVKDVVEGYLLLASKMKKLGLYGQAFNFSNEKPVSVLKLVSAIYKLCGQESNYKIVNQAKAEIRDQYLSSQKAKKILGWRAKYNLERGLQKTIKWYTKVYSFV
ncbi:MAG TPA: NAD-dependent epimerase/dehydratase family protein [Candidatus Bathyarchaeia archaeon]|nr:NAD-dependent epimerase/dehydratase family protein [Candidatus Bathyarchaeia archaeon]